MQQRVKSLFVTPTMCSAVSLLLKRRAIADPHIALTACQAQEEAGVRDERGGHGLATAVTESLMVSLWFFWLRSKGLPPSVSPSAELFYT